jgi:hypothetical protein
MHRLLSALPLKSKGIALDRSLGADSALVCPRCRETDLHHGRVTVFDRPEDGEITAVTTVHDGAFSNNRLQSDLVDNPSDRRRGSAIAFQCEHCGGGLELTIAQHKGTTFLSWRFDPLEKAPKFEGSIFGNALPPLGGK